MASDTVALDKPSVGQPIEKEIEETKMVLDEEVVHKEDGEERKKQVVEFVKDTESTESEGLAHKAEEETKPVEQTEPPPVTISEVVETGGVPPEPTVATLKEVEVSETPEPLPVAAEPVGSKPEDKAEEAVLKHTFVEEKREMEAEKVKVEEKPAVEAVREKLEQKSEEEVESKQEESVMAKEVENKVDEKPENEVVKSKLEEKVETEAAVACEAKEQRGSETVTAESVEKAVDVKVASESEEKVAVEVVQSEVKEQETKDAVEVVQSEVKEQETKDAVEAEVTEKVEAEKSASGSVEKVEAETVEKESEMKETAEAVKEELKEEAVAQSAEKIEVVKEVASEIVNPKEVSEKVDEADTKPSEALSITENVAEKVEEVDQTKEKDHSAVADEVQVTSKEVSATLGEAFATEDTKSEQAAMVEDKAVLSEVAEQVKENWSEKIEENTEELNLAQKITPETGKVEEVEKKGVPKKEEMPALVEAPKDSKEVNAEEAVGSPETKESDKTKASRDLPVQEVPAKPAKQSGNIISKVKQSLVKVKKAIVGKSPSSKTLTVDVKEGEKVK